MNEVLIASFFFLVLLGAVAFYFYARMLYTERKIGLLENILLDIKMSMEMEEDERILQGAGRPNGQAAPVAPPSAPENPEALTGATIEEVKEDEAFYSSVLNSAQEQVEEFLPTEPTTTRPPSSTEPDYDSMSREELAAAAEKAGIRVTKRMNRGTIVALLRDVTKKASEEPETGSGDGDLPGVDGSSDGAPLDLGAVDAVPLEST